MAYEMTLDLYNFEKKIVVGDKAQPMTADTLHVAIPELKGGKTPSKPSFEELLERICIELTKQGVSLRLERGPKDELGKVTFEKQSGFTFTGTIGGATGGKDGWIFRMTDPGGDEKKQTFVDLCKLPIVSGTKINMFYGPKA